MTVHNCLTNDNVKATDTKCRLQTTYRTNALDLLTC